MLLLACVLDVVLGCWRVLMPMWSLARADVIGVVTVRCRVACVVSVVVNNILSARVVLSSVVAVVAAVRRNELSQSDGAARQLWMLSFV